MKFNIKFANTLSDDWICFLEKQDDQDLEFIYDVTIKLLDGSKIYIKNVSNTFEQDGQMLVLSEHNGYLVFHTNVIDEVLFKYINNIRPGDTF